jgi:hypothetical protein
MKTPLNNTSDLNGEHLRTIIEHDKKELAKAKLKTKRLLEHQDRIYNFMYSKLSEKDKMKVDKWKNEKVV